METILKKLEEELKLRNFSKKTIKSYLFEAEKFLKFSQSKGLNEKTAREYFLKQLEKRIQQQSPIILALSLFSLIKL